MRLAIPYNKSAIIGLPLELQALILSDHADIQNYEGHDVIYFKFLDSELDAKVSFRRVLDGRQWLDRQKNINLSQFKFELRFNVEVELMNEHNIFYISSFEVEKLTKIDIPIDFESTVVVDKELDKISVDLVLAVIEHSYGLERYIKDHK
jgi:hypothetical protein